MSGVKIVNKREFFENLYQANYEDLSEEELNIFRPGCYDSEGYLGKCFCSESILNYGCCNYFKVLTTVSNRPDCVTALCFNNPPAIRVKNLAVYEDNTITVDLSEEDCGNICIREVDVSELEACEEIEEADFFEAMMEYYAYISDAGNWRRICRLMVCTDLIG